MTDRHFDPEELLHSIVEMEHRLICMEAGLKSDAAALPEKQHAIDLTGNPKSSEIARPDSERTENDRLVETLLIELQKAKAAVLNINDLHDYYRNNHIDELYRGESPHFYHNKRDRRIVIIVVVFMLYVLFSLFMMIR